MRITSDISDTSVGNSPLHPGEVPEVDNTPISILILDDEPKNLTVLETVLDDPSYRLVRAVTAEEALLALVSEEFALLIFDVSMPGMNGFELAQIIKSRKKTSNIPIIFLTAYYYEDQHVLEGYSTGAVDYLHKPVNAMVLKSKVAVFAELYRKSRKLSQTNSYLLNEVIERRRAEAELRDLNETLESRIFERTEQLRLNQALLSQAAEAARLSYLEIDFVRGQVRPAENFEAVMGFELCKESVTDIASGSIILLDHVVEEDQPLLLNTYEKFIRGEGVGRIRYRVRGHDCMERWIESHWSIGRNRAGEPQILFATNLDVSIARMSEEALRYSEERLRLALDSAELGSWRIDPARGVLTSDERFREITGTSGNLLHYEDSLRSIHPDDLERVRTALIKTITSLDPIPFEAEYRVILPGGAVRWVFAKGRANYADPRLKDQIRSIDGTVTDITARKRAEEELRRANHDLQQFAFSASHDLQEPLRNVSVYCELFKEQFADKLDPQGEKYLNFVVEGAQRTSALIADLLQYTRAVEEETSPQTAVDANEVITQVIENLDGSVRSNQGKITYDPLPSLLIHSLHLEQLLQNLISNGLKYRKDNEPPHVHVSASNENGSWKISVRDNGIGIPEQYQQHVFGLFKRLHPRSEKYPGTGIGLAICYKIVERYGGRIWIESSHGEGTVFHFTLPSSRAN